mmetsp:Transcript_59681/g.69755  ORF Transcript_59681/g.69755 Transcript_59681/m.69755 type:complete len:439 (+) Transcript_59681:62-1378(+)|eukprot:CAMPEP_0194415938 /NCGR_PEP_ID=MMETSP0176-20130528/14795_1 /TAXON_ID=216777 /ORGANISM="Proboscia alata, Strain PI-D3" /LENGTH=438 /DNA_ID=CAMNT_0039220907 /DNA_START=50 /DNA_END=1366 /DNA_ORIENTATION=-
MRVNYHVIFILSAVTRGIFFATSEVNAVESSAASNFSTNQADNVDVSNYAANLPSSSGSSRRLKSKGKKGKKAKKQKKVNTAKKAKLEKRSKKASSGIGVQSSGIGIQYWPECDRDAVIRLNLTEVDGSRSLSVCEPGKTEEFFQGVAKILAGALIEGNMVAILSSIGITVAAGAVAPAAAIFWLTVSLGVGLFCSTGVTKPLVLDINNIARFAREAAEETLNSKMLGTLEATARFMSTFTTGMTIGDIGDHIQVYNRLLSESATLGVIGAPIFTNSVMLLYGLLDSIKVHAEETKNSPCCEIANTNMEGTYKDAVVTNYDEIIKDLNKYKADTKGTDRIRYTYPKTWFCGIGGYQYEVHAHFVGRNGQKVEGYTASHNPGVTFQCSFTSTLENIAKNKLMPEIDRYFRDLKNKMFSTTFNNFYDDLKNREEQCVMND